MGSRLRLGDQGKGGIKMKHARFIELTELHGTEFARFTESVP